MPTCRDMSELVTDYVEGALPSRVWVSARWHLVLCGACRAYFAQMRETVGLLARLPQPSPPPGVEDRVIARLGAGDADKPA